MVNKVPISILSFLTYCHAIRTTHRNDVPLHVPVGNTPRALAVVTISDARARWRHFDSLHREGTETVISSVLIRLRDDPR